MAVTITLSTGKLSVPTEAKELFGLLIAFFSLAVWEHDIFSDRRRYAAIQLHQHRFGLPAAEDLVCCG